jgi:hypothetical protein
MDFLGIDHHHRARPDPLAQAPLAQVLMPPVITPMEKLSWEWGA